MTRWTVKSRSFLYPIAAIALAAVALLAACDDSPTGPEVRQDGELHFLRLGVNAPLLRDTVVTFYAKRGEDREVRLRYLVDPLSGETEEYFRFVVPSEALERRPDGTPFVLGDSIQITVRVANLTALVFDFQPSGLRFSAAHPARLRIEYARADDDLDEDGDIDVEDESLEQRIALWRQEAPGLPWVKMATLLHVETDEVEADLLGFTGYALAY